ncbi:DUF58 domain-containing protein [Nereida sp. MMG025]|uniref:DUF58 domain-containing protein n=1 Tax=Nereida sp. MMG025 TaxID=2909981 RepID=UPI001F199431|nr:DUF58 domain-containing protein [Nereida sp. MMG025]MCF6445450.1 DUF58 domain-containing protein [Nereida sp. MMG025]
MSQPTAPLRLRAEVEAASLPPLLAAADHLAATVMMGIHGRRRAGVGDEFWQYRPERTGDELRMIDWRRSAKSMGGRFVREREWQNAQSVIMWIDSAASMRFSSGTYDSKSDRARLLGMALAVLLLRGGERVGLTAFDAPPRTGEAQVQRLAMLLSAEGDTADYGEPEARGMIPQSRAVFVSDFMGDMAPVEAALTKAADRGVKGVLLQVLDPQEESFPFKGRTVFESVGGSLRHETLKANDLQARYLDRLAERKDLLRGMARASGWQFSTHHTGDAAQSALMWMYQAMQRV